MLLTAVAAAVLPLNITPSAVDDIEANVVAMPLLFLDGSIGVVVAVKCKHPSHTPVHIQINKSRRNNRNNGVAVS